MSDEWKNIGDIITNALNELNKGFEEIMRLEMEKIEKIKKLLQEQGEWEKENQNGSKD